MRSHLLIFIGLIECCLSFHPGVTTYHITKPLSKKDRHNIFLTHIPRKRQIRKYDSSTTTTTTTTTTMKLSPETITATSTIVVSSFVGFASDQSQYSQDSGLLITLVLATILSNFGLFGYAVPSIHPIYDFCWTKFLPASLALILFSAPSDSSENKKGYEEEGNKVASIMNNDNRILNTKELVFAIGVPFVIGSIGSILGCLFSRFFQVWAGSINSMKNIGIGPVEASVAAGRSKHHEINLA